MKTTVSVLAMMRKETSGVIWRDTSQESAWLLEAKNFLGFLCAHQNDALRHLKPRTCLASLLSERRKANHLLR